MNRLEKIDSILIISFLALLIFPLLYLFRHLDDNTLTSWRWVFAGGGMLRAFGFIALGTIAAFLLSRTAFPDRNPPLFLFLLSFLAVVPLWQEPEVILDASRYFLQAKHLELYGISSFFGAWGGEVAGWTDLPVVPFFYGMIFKCLGEARIYIQAFNALLFSLTVVLACRIGTALWGRETGLLAGLLLLGIPYLLTQAPLMLVDVPVMFLLTLSLSTFLDAVEKGGPLRIAIASAAVVLAVFSKYSAWLMLLVLPVASLVSARSGRRAVLLRSAAVLASAVVLTAAIFSAKYDIFMHQLDLLREYQWPGLRRWQEGLASTFFFQTHPAVTLAALFAVPLAVKNRDARFFIPAWFAVFALALRVERIRYLLPLFPLFSLMAAYGLTAVKDAGIRKFIAFGVLATSLAVALGAYLPFLNRTSAANLRDAGRYLDTLPGDAVEVRVLPQKRSTGNTEAAIPLLDLFTRKKIVYHRERIASPDAERLFKSPLRFSWEFGRPRFYAEAADAVAMPLVVIASEPFTGAGHVDQGDDPPHANFSGKEPPAAGHARSPVVFASDTGTFRYRTVVTVFDKTLLAETAQEPFPPCSFRDSIFPQLLSCR